MPPDLLPGSHPRDPDRSPPLRSGAVRVAPPRTRHRPPLRGGGRPSRTRPGPAPAGPPGAQSRAPLPPPATAGAVPPPTTDPSPNRAASAAVAAPTAATTSAHRDLVAFGIDTSTPAATAIATNQLRTTSARPPITRNQPRTVPTGTPNRAPIARCPAPAALATNAAQIRSAR